MKVLIITLIFCFMVLNAGARRSNLFYEPLEEIIVIRHFPVEAEEEYYDAYFEVLPQYAILQNLLDEGFDEINGEGNWLIAQEERDWQNDESKLYTRKLKIFRQNEVKDFGAKAFVDSNNMTIDTQTLYDHNFDVTDAGKNYLYVLNNKGKDINPETGRDRLWDSVVGDKYATYLLETPDHIRINNQLKAPYAWVKRKLYGIEDQ